MLQEYSIWAIRNDGPLLDLVTWLGNWLWVPILGLLLTYPFLLFPDGKLPSPRWRVVAWGSAIALAAWSVAFAFQTEDFTDALGDPAPNPFAIAGLGSFFNGARVAIALIVLAFAGACVVSLVIRFRRARGDERQQIKWLMYSAALVVAWFTLPVEHGAGGTVDAVQGVVLALIPLSVGVAVLKYRLYDIDLVIRKTVVFALLAGFIGGRVRRDRGWHRRDRRRGIEHDAGVRRRCGARDRVPAGARRRATLRRPARVREARDAVRGALRVLGPDRARPTRPRTCSPGWRRSLGEGTGAVAATVWLRVGGEVRPAASWPDDRDLAPVAIAEDALPDLGETLGRGPSTAASSSVRLSPDVPAATRCPPPRAG